MRGFLRVGVAAAVAIAVAIAALRLSGAWRWVEGQYKGPSGRGGRIVAWTMPRMFGWLYARLSAALDLQPEDEVLDVACGSGEFLRKHAAHVHRIAGLDHSEIQIDLALRQNSRRVADGTAEFVVGDVTELPWPDDEFSVVTSNCVDCFDEKAQRALEEMFRVLRPGGRAVVADDYERLMELAGFSRLSVGRAGWGRITTGFKPL